MTDFTDYKLLFLKNYDRLTKNQKKIAQFLLDHPEEIAFSSIDIIAEKLNVGKATIVRLAQSMGYKGFLELKTELSQKLRNNISSTKKFKAALDNVNLKSDYLETIANNECKNINAMLHSLDQVAFDKAVKIFVDAPAIYTLGLGISSFLSQMAAYFLNRTSMKAKAFTHGSISFQEQIVSLRKNEAILAFSLPPYSIDTIEAVENARAKGIKIISITDKIISPITKFSNVVFTAQTNNIVFVNTVSSVLVIIYALAAGVGLTDRTTSLKAISSFEKAKSEFGFDVHSEFFK